MKMRATSLLALACTAGLAAGHGILQVPKARTGQAVAPGIKLTPFENAITVANAGCGNAAGGDPGPSVSRSATYTAGSKVKVEWDVTIPHAIDNTNTGIRIAVHYQTGDSYAQNILAGPGSDPALGLTTVSAQVGGTRRQSLEVQLPTGKTSATAVLQWMWAAQNDRGFYLGCSDVAIVAGVPTPLTPTPPPTPPPTNAPGITSAPTPAPAGIPTVQIQFEIRGDQQIYLDGLDSKIKLDVLYEELAKFYNVSAAQIEIEQPVVPIPAEGSKEAGVRVVLRINELSKEGAKTVVNKSDEKGLAKAINAVPGFDNAAPVITDWTMCNTGEKDGCTSSVKAEDSTPVATIALVALAVPIVAVGVIVGLGGKKGRALLLNGERS